MEGSLRQVNENSLEIFWQALRSGRPGPWASDHFEQSKHFVGPVYTVVDALASWVGSSTLKLVKRDDSKPTKTEIAKSMIRKAMPVAGAQDQDHKWEPLEEDHPAWQPFLHPNPQQTTADFLYEDTLQMCLTGSALTWIIPNGYGEPAELYILPQGMTNALPPTPAFPGGAYRVMPLFTSGPFANIPGYAAMGGTIIPAEYVAVNRKAHPYIKYDGYSPLQAAAVQLDILQQIDDSRWYAFQNGIDPSMYVTLPPGTTHSQWKELQAKLEENHSGTRNRKKPMALLGGASPVFGSHAPGAMGYETGWDQVVKFVCSCFRTPAVIAGLADSATYAEWYAALKQFYTGTLVPICRSIAEHYTLHIIGKVPEWEGIRIQIDPPAIDDRDQQNGVVDRLMQGGAITKGELRIIYGMEPFGDERDEEIAGTPDINEMNLNLKGMDGSDAMTKVQDRIRPKPGQAEGSLPDRVAKAFLNGHTNGTI